jgi:ankyrin repeat protein
MSLLKKLFGSSLSKILEATKHGDLKNIKELLHDHPDLVFSKDKNSLTSLHLAAANGHKDVAELLLAHNADVNAEDIKVSP